MGRGGPRGVEFLRVSLRIWEPHGFPRNPNDLQGWGPDSPPPARFRFACFFGSGLYYVSRLARGRPGAAEKRTGS